ncbi:MULTISPECIES: c-type cytochrome [unclassified Helicobacter]|uniref:c-type cytochrome n=1 Tax=unclassified Helicobacter TaxID=2593540 RepID=UPI000CF10DFE|nr:MULTISPECIES: c-type cytochrome [unclassified Helicobacter]
MKRILSLCFFSAMVVSADPAAIIKSKCASCHGTNMEKAALGKSHIVSNMSASEIEETLKGYKAKTLNKYGLGGTMWGQAGALSDSDISEIAKYITTNLKK